MNLLSDFTGLDGYICVLALENKVSFEIVVLDVE